MRCNGGKNVTLADGGVLWYRSIDFSTNKKICVCVFLLAMKHMKLIPVANLFWFFVFFLYFFLSISICMNVCFSFIVRFDWYINHWARVQFNKDSQVRASVQPQSSSILIFFCFVSSFFPHSFVSFCDNEHLTQFSLYVCVCFSYHCCSRRHRHQFRWTFKLFFVPCRCVAGNAYL